MVWLGVCEAAVTVRKAQGRNPARKVANPRAAIAVVEVVFLATIFQANEATPSAVTDALKGKEQIDCTDPVGPNLSHGLIGVQPGSEVIQKLLPDTRVVKAFTIYGFANFENFDYDVKPVMIDAR
jgi:predicted dinucleotide-binding enzyme